MLRRIHFIPVVFAAATFASGCLSSVGTDYGPQGGSPTPGPSAGTPGGNAGAGSAAGASGGGDGTTGTGTGVGSGAGQDPGTAAQPAPSGPAAVAGTLAVKLSATSDSIRLNETKTYQATVTPSADFSGGNVIYSATGLPAGVTAAFNPLGGMVATSPVMVTLTLKSAADATALTGSALKIIATSGAIVGQAPLVLDVKAELLVSIAKGVDIGTSATPNLAAFGAASIPTLFVAPGTKVTFVNGDAINHEIHSDGSLGIAHEGGPLMANGANAYTQTFSAKGTFNFRCHIHPNMKGQIVVK